MTRLRSLLALVIALAPSVAACGGNAAAQSATAGARAVTEAVSANNRTPALDPRTNDPTASPAAQPGPATAGTGLSFSNKAPGSGAAAATNGSSSTTSTATTTGATAASEPADPPSKISARHVLVQWMGADRAGKSVMRTREQALVLAQEVLRKAKAGEDIGRLANEYSDEPNAGARGGSLGRFGRGQMVPAFDQVVFKLKVGELSDIVETPFGFHVIQRTE